MPTSTREGIAAGAIDDLPQIWDGFAKLVRTGLGISAFGAQIMELDPDHIVRVDPGVGRVLASGPDGLRVLCIGGVPGAPYTPPEWTAALPEA